ncbi:MAG: hypothetical protein AAB554_04700 [Patescibacteria group bacterium]
MPNENPRLIDKKTVRFGLMSRIDFGSDGFRQGLLELAAEIFKADDVAFVILAGGLVSGKAVADKTVRLHKEMRSTERQIKAKEKSMKDVSDPKEIDAARKALAKLKATRDKVKKQLEALTPAKMAEELAKCLPKFTNAKGQSVKLYFVPSPAYDKTIGEDTGEALRALRDGDEFRLLKPGSDRLALWEHTADERMLEVLTSDKQAWLRGDFHSTPVQRRIKDKRRQTSSGVRVDLQVVGGVGVSLLKPEGHWPIGFVSVPALHRLDDTGIAENQVGVQIIEVETVRRNVAMRSYPFGDAISRERTFIGLPSDPTAAQQKCIDGLRHNGRTTTGSLSQMTGLSKEAVRKALDILLATKDHKRYATWPGLVYDAASDRWDFDLEWVKRNLRYRAPEGERKVDKVVAICCMHAGSLDTDYDHFLTEVPRVMLERGVGTLVSAGDHVEGTSHDLLLKGEIYAGFDNTTQEELAASMIATVLFKVFKVRFDAALKASLPKKWEETAALVKATLPIFRYVPGNHCGWVSKHGIKPLNTMVHEIVRLLTEWVEDHLATKGLQIVSAMRLVKSHVQTVPKGRFTLPSGLPMGMTHPHMGGSETISSAAQKAFMKYRDCPVVFIGNFHTGVVVEERSAQLGQRICMQIGTQKHGSSYEDGFMKTVDQGFGYAEIISVSGRIVGTVTTFYGNDKAGPEEKRLDGRKPYNDFLAQHGMRQ